MPRHFLVIISALTASAAVLRADSFFVSNFNGVAQYSATSGALMNELALPLNEGNGFGGFIDPTGMAIGADGSLYVADANAANPNLGIVYKFNSITGVYEGVFTSDSSLSGPVGIAFGKNGDLYVANYNYLNPNAPYFSVYNSSGALVNEFGAGPANPQIISPPTGGMAFGPNGDLYFPDGDNGVDQYTAAGTFVQSFGWPSPVANPSGIAIDSAGNIYVTDLSNNIVVEFDSAGNYVATFNPGAGWDQPTDLVFGPGGNLFITDDSGISEYNFSTLGAFEPWPGSDGTTSSGEFIVYSSVPEPGTLASFALAGLGLALLWWRRRFGASG